MPLAFALSIADRTRVGPQSKTIALVLDALHQSGWKIVPRDAKPAVRLKASKIRLQIGPRV